MNFSLIGWSQWLALAENFNWSLLYSIEDSMFMGENGEIQTLVRNGGKKEQKARTQVRYTRAKTQSGHKGISKEQKTDYFLKVHSCEHNEAMVATEQNHTNQP